MKHVTTALFSIAAVCTVASATPAAAIGGDMTAAKQQIHSPYDAARAYAYGSPRYVYTQPIYGYGVIYPAPVAQCYLAQDWTGQLMTVCP